MKRLSGIACSGYCGEESPKAFILYGQRIQAVGVRGGWVEERLDDRVRKRFFKVEGSDGVLHKIFYSEKSLEWYHRFQGE